MKNKLSTLLRLFAFFILIATIVTVSVIVFGSIEKRIDSKIIIALVMLIVVISLFAIFTIFDYFHNKYTIEKRVNEILKATNAIAS